MGIRVGVTGSGAGSGEGVNEAAVALSEILLNNYNIRGTGMDGLLVSALGINP